MLDYSTEIKMKINIVKVTMNARIEYYKYRSLLTRYFFNLKVQQKM